MKVNAARRIHAFKKHKLKPLLKFLLKMGWNWNRWCFWHHKLPCNQSHQCVIVMSV